jgi:hypothetical protein
LIRKTKAVVSALLDRHGTSFVEELGIDLGEEHAVGPVSVVVRVDPDERANFFDQRRCGAAKALADAGWTTAAGTWRKVQLGRARKGAERERLRALRREHGADAGRGRRHVAGDRYHGDLRKLREKAGVTTRPQYGQLLKEFKGIGDVGADIFCRETQIAWDELYPFADRKALASATKLGLPGSADALAALVDRADFPRLAAALVRCDLAGDHEAVRKAAGM